MWAVRLELQRTIAKQCQQPVPQARRLLKAHTQAKVEARHWEHRPSISHMGSSPILQAGGSDAEDGHKVLMPTLELPVMRRDLMVADQLPADWEGLCPVV